MADLDLIDREFRNFGTIKPTWRAYLLHIGLLLVTLFTATIAGVLYPFGKIDIFPRDDPQSFQEALQFIASLPVRYAVLIGDVLSTLAANHALLAEQN